MKKFILSILISLSFCTSLFAQVGINATNSLPDPSAMLDVKSNSKGLLIPRMTTAERDNIGSPAAFLMILNTTTVCFEAFNPLTSAWETIHCFECPVPVTPTAGAHVPSPTEIIWNWNSVNGALGYKWNTINDYATALDLGNATTLTQTGLNCWTTYYLRVWAYNACGNSNPVWFMQSTLPIPFSPAPTAGTHVPSFSQIVWHWNSVSGATGYKWSTQNNYNTATDMGTNTQKSETGLTCATAYTRYVWAYDNCGYSDPTVLTQSTPSCWVCGQPLVDARDANSYNTVQIGTQCWMAQNLNIGTKITIPVNQTNNGILEKYCYNDNDANCITYGGIYQWDEAIQAPNLMTESFETGSGLTPPAGWALELVTGATQGVSFVTSGTNPTVSTAYNGTRFVRYNSYAINGGSTRLKKTVAMSTINKSSITVDFAWYEDPVYPTSNDKVEVQWSTTGTSWATVGTFIRYNATPGWKIKNVLLPAGADNQPALYVAFLFTSGYGNDCSLDFAHVSGISTGQALQGNCPSGWHLPSDDEWTTLAAYLGGKPVAGGMMKEAGTSHWSSSNTGATNSSGFTALPGGFVNENSAWTNMLSNAYFWSSSQSSSSNAWYRGLKYDDATVESTDVSRTAGLSVRCIHD